MKKVYVITLFPDLVRPYLADSILWRAQEAGLISVEVVNPRDFTADKHRKADDIPYGGGPGMVLKAEPILLALDSLGLEKPEVVIPGPGGEEFSNTTALKLAKSKKPLVIIAGRYEGIDARVKKITKAKEYSVGPYVLSGGELPALVMIEALARQIPGVLGKQESLEEKRHGVGVPSYTRPESFEYKGKKQKVPPVLLSGHHKNIEEWRTESKSRKLK